MTWTRTFGQSLLRGFDLLLFSVGRLSSAAPVGLKTRLARLVASSLSKPRLYRLALLFPRSLRPEGWIRASAAWYSFQRGLFRRPCQNVVLQKTGFLVGSTTYPFTMELNIGDPLGASWYYDDAYEPYAPYQPEHFLLHVLAPGDTYVDIGSNAGFFPLVAAQLVGPSGSVICYEADPANFEALERNIALSGSRIIEAVPLAVSDHNGTAALRRNIAHHSGAHSLASEAGVTPVDLAGAITPVAVSTTTIDSHLGERDLGRLKLVKLDIEGHEGHALRGMQRTLRKWRVPYVIAEVNPPLLARHGTRPQHLEVVMGSLGYRSFDYLAGKLVPVPTDELTTTKDVVFVLEPEQDPGGGYSSGAGQA